MPFKKGDKSSGRRGSQRRLSPKALKAISYYIQGETQDMALEKAGMSSTTGNASQFFNRPIIVAEVAKRMKRNMKKAELSEQWVIERQMRIADAMFALAKFQKVIKRDKRNEEGALVEKKGQVITDYSGATEEELALINVKVSDAKSALDSPARIQGQFQDTLEVKHEVSLIERLQAGRERARLTGTAKLGDDAKLIGEGTGDE